MPHLSLGEQVVHYSHSGGGAQALFVHGSFANAAAWRGILQKLETQPIESITIDLMGCGGSSPAVTGRSLLGQDIAALERVAQHAASRPVHLIGHSYGGIVCLGAALKGAVPIASLTLFEPLPIMVLNETGDGHHVEYIRSFLEGYEAAYRAGEKWAFSRVIHLWGGQGAFDAMPEKIRDAMAPATADNIRQWHDNLSFTPSLDAYRALAVPTTLVQGEHANPIVKAIITRLSTLMPNASVHQVSRAGHFMIHSHAADCAELVRKRIA